MLLHNIVDISTSLAGTDMIELSNETEAQLRAELEVMNKHDFKSACTHTEKYKTSPRKRGQYGMWT